MRRVAWVRIVIAGDVVRAEAHGVGHRLLCTVPVPMTMATALVAEGAPLVVHRSGDDRQLSKAAGR